MNTWNTISRIILKKRILLLSFILITTLFWLFKAQNLKFTFKEANLLPDYHQENIIYNEFTSHFGDEGNSIVIGIKDSILSSKEKLFAWNNLTKKLSSFSEIEYSISLNDLKILKKNEDSIRFDFIPLINDDSFEKIDLDSIKNKLKNELPFYKNLVYNDGNETFRSILIMQNNIINTNSRKNFILQKFIPIVKRFEKSNNIDVKISGMPYVRTLNAENILNEMKFFVLIAILVTALIFFLFFKSIKATVISILVVLIGVIWALGTIGLLQYEITVLTALIPPLIIVIGIPNCIYLINKYQQEILNHGNQIKSLERVIVKIGKATLITNLTTASGFATFILTNSKLLKEFGVIASLNVMGIFIISLIIIPIYFSYFSIPQKKHLNHLESKSINSLLNWMENKIKYNKKIIYSVSFTLLIICSYGISQIKISGNLLEDMPNKKNFFKDIVFFNDYFNGIVPLEILINTGKKNGVKNLTSLKKIEKLKSVINTIPELSRPISIVDVVKYSKQTFYNGNPNFFKIPSRQENNFISQYIKNSKSDSKILNSYSDKSSQYARVTTYMKDISTERMYEIEKILKKSINEIFPNKRYSVKLTGKSILFLKGTEFLVKNLIFSLCIAIFLIAIFMAFMFKSVKMIVISLIPNLLPLVFTAGAMGFLGITLRPSTILVFTIAFGISVDDTIHFLAKYRQELWDNKFDVTKSVFKSLKETGVSMYYTSIVLFFGFSVFLTSDFGGTIALGGLVSLTLLLAMLTNLLLLPSLLISFKK
ncbi:MAG: RND family transporter [Flavobacteriaceae bacterium]